MRANKGFVCLSVIFFVGVGQSACSQAVSESEDVGTTVATTSQPIVGGSRATQYPESTLIDMIFSGNSRAACSGAVIAPKVILTAGHCVEGVSRFEITVPYANNQKASSTRKKVYDWRSTGNTVNPNVHDIGLIFLDKAIQLSAYPVIANSKSPDGSSLINVGRINNGKLSSTDLYAGKPVVVTDATSDGFPFDYISNEIIQSGDSGGPVFVPNSSPHSIAAVNSGAGGGTQVLARTDLLYNWIDTEVKANGGWGTGGGNGGGWGNDGGTGGGGNDGGTGTPTCSGASESEPNDDYRSPNALSGARCGSLGASDQDWFSWSVSGAGVAYEVDLETAGDAEIQMWKQTSSGWSKIANTTSTNFLKTSSGSGNYVVVVWSQTGSTQGYRLTLTK